MYKKFYLLLLLLFYFYCVCAQKETHFWYFGNKAGLDFNNLSTLKNGTFNNSEGCASISDRNGELLFYTSADSVWNKNNQLMPNGAGLLGCKSSTQAAIIIPDPSNSSKFYLFTTDCTENSYIDGLRYSIVNMSLDSGLGDVETGSKNTSLLIPASEKLAAVLHCNGTDYWLVTQNNSTNSFYTFLITASGINSPIISSIGSINPTAYGQIKFSPDGRRLAATVSGLNLVEVFDFDNSTGIISNCLQLTGTNSAYGVEFSSNNSLLYVSVQDGTRNIYQYNLLAGSAAAISSSIVTIGTSANSVGSLQLAPNGIIFIARERATLGEPLSQYLAGIVFPNIVGTACNFIDNAVYLAGKRSRLGLPNFIASYFDSFQINLGNDTSICAKEIILNPNFQGISYLWSTGDTTSTIKVSQSGTYWVEVRNGSCTKKDSINILNTFPFVNLGNDSIFCTSAYTLDAGYPGSTYIWSTGDTTQSIIVSNSGTYWVTVNAGLCSNSDTISLTNNSLEINLGNDTTICTDTFVLDAGGGAISYLWSTSDTIPSITIESSGTYWVLVSNNSCSDTDSINLINNLPQIELGTDTNICSSHILDASTPGALYLWSTGDTTQLISVFNSGTYWVTVNNLGCINNDTIDITNNSISLNLGKDTSICSSHILNAGNTGYNFLWSTGDTTQTITVYSSGSYIVNVNNNVCNANDTINVTNASPLLYLGNDTIFCSIHILDAGNIGSNYLWSTGDTTQIVAIINSGTYWVEVNNGVCSKKDTISLIDNSFSINIGNDTSVCDSYLLDVPNLGGKYLWSTGDTTSSINILSSGTYYLSVSNNGCNASDTINVTITSISLDLGSDTTICSPSFSLDAGNSGTNYLWSTEQTCQIINVSSSGTYWVHVNKDLCFKSDTVLITNKSLILDLGNDTTLCGSAFTMTAKNPQAKYLWSIGDTSHTITISAPGTYWVTVSNDVCTETDSITVSYFTDSVVIRVPNIFSPNGDGYNDAFNIITNDIGNYFLKIYDRWGNEIYATTDVHQNWDGKYNGSDASEGIYFWELSCNSLCAANRSFSKKGSVTLLR